MQNHPFFSVIITTYNRFDLLPRAINSLLNQTEKDWEAIIVDDGSEDETYEFSIGIARKHPNITYIYRTNRGTPHSRQTGINLAQGYYITFLDSDDEYLPEHLKLRKRILIENPLIDFLYGGYQVVGSKFVPDIHNPNKLISLDNCVVGGTFFIRKSIISQIGGIPQIEYGDDARLYQILKEKRFIVRKVNFPTYIYHRDHPDSKTFTYFATQSSSTK